MSSLMDIETPRHLFQPTLYRSASGSWHKDFWEALVASGPTLHWDEAAVLGVLSWGYVPGDRTIVREVKRRPWLSEARPDGTAQLQTVPQHGRHWYRAATAAKRLACLLENEVLRICEGRSRVYLLLSGGLDSRVIAGVLSRLRDAGRLRAELVAVTWGINGSRDVIIAQEIARRLGFRWQHLLLTGAQIIDNVHLCARFLGAQLAPHHLHAMPWFQSMQRDALIIAASYGDSVGRAEFSKRHVLELSRLSPGNGWGILNSGVLARARAEVQAELDSFRLRSPGRPHYVLNEHEMYGHYMRNMLAHCMGIINQWCKVYQMFTDPEVYSFMWSLHPASRTNAIYACLLEELGYGLARLPWARTGRALAGRTEAIGDGATKEFHCYNAWTREEVYDRLRPKVDPLWFERTGLFNRSAIVDLTSALKAGAPFFCAGPAAPHELWLWLATLRQFAEMVADMGCTLSVADSPGPNKHMPFRSLKRGHVSAVRAILQRSPRLKELLKSCRRFALRVVSLIRYPPAGRT